MIVTLLASLLPYQLQATHADFDGTNLTLTQEVELIHPLGRILAKRALLQCLHMDLHTPFHRMELDGNVEVHVTTSSRDLHLSANHAEGEIDAASLFAFQRLTIQGDVTCTTSDGLTASGGLAHYSALAGQAGSIEFFPSPPLSSCYLTHHQDLFEASHLSFDLTTSEISAQEVSGDIYQQNASPIHVSSPHLIWRPGSLELSGGESICFPDRSGLLTCQGPLRFERQQNLLHTDRPFSYQDEHIYLEADRGRLSLSHLQPEALYCEGSIRMISQKKESSCNALADQLVYFPSTRTLILSSKSPQRVLFWQTNGSLRLSAPEVHMCLDAKEKEEEIQGMGDVHFTFNLEEEHLIETLFSKYLNPSSHEHSLRSSPSH